MLPALLASGSAADACREATLFPGDLVVGDTRTPAMISTVNPATGVKTLVCSCTVITSLRDVAVRGSETIYTVGQIMSSVTEAVVEVNPATGAERIVSSGGNFNRLEGIAVEADGNIVVTDTPIFGGLASSVIRVNPATGAQTVISSGNRLRQGFGVA